MHIGENEQTAAQPAPEETDEDRAIKLGFVYDVRRQKWTHSVDKWYGTHKAKYAVEDYPDILKNKKMIDAMTNAKRSTLSRTIPTYLKTKR